MTRKRDGTVRLGRSELSVSRLGLGTWQLSPDWGDADERALTTAIRQARELGINLFDTAQGDQPHPSPPKKERIPRSTLSPFRIRDLQESSSTSGARSTGNHGPAAATHYARGREIEPFIGRAPRRAAVLAAARVPVGLLDPLPDRGLGQVEILRDLADGPVTALRG